MGVEGTPGGPLAACCAPLSSGGIVLGTELMRPSPIALATGDIAGAARAAADDRARLTSDGEGVSADGARAARANGSRAARNSAVVANRSGGDAAIARWTAAQRAGASSGARSESREIWPDR